MAAKSLKFKTPKVPHCPSVQEARGTFSEMGRIIRKARHDYLVKLWQAAEHLKGKSLVAFVKAGAERMNKAGMYAPGYYSEVPWSIVRRFHKFDVPNSRVGDWHKWLRMRQISPMDLRSAKYSERMQKFWRGVLSGTDSK